MHHTSITVAFVCWCAFRSTHYSFSGGQRPCAYVANESTLNSFLTLRLEGIKQAKCVRELKQQRRRQQPERENAFKPYDQHLISHLLLLLISYRSSGKKLIKFQGNSFCVIMSTIHMAPLCVTNFLLLRSSMEDVKIRRQIFLLELGYSPEKISFPSIDRGPNERDRV